MISITEKSFLLAVAYGVASFFLIFLDRITVIHYRFDYHIVVLMLQFAVALIAMEVLKLFGMIKLSPYVFERGWDWIVPSVLYSLHRLFSYYHLEGPPMPFYGAIRRAAPILIVYCYAELVKKPRPRETTLLAYGLITVGSILACLHPGITAISILYGLIGMASEVAILLWLEVFVGKYTTIELLHMTCFNGLVFFMILEFITDQLRPAISYLVVAATPLFYVYLVALLIIGALHHTALFYCMAHNSALFTSIVGNVRSLVMVALGWLTGLYLLFEEIHEWNVLGLLIGLAGTYLYFFPDQVRVSRHESSVIVNSNSIPIRSM